MAVVINGVTVPQDSANAFKFNGSDVTDAYFNGTKVFTQSLFSATWSGSSTAPFFTSAVGINTSGGSARAYYSSSGTPSYGGWSTVTSSGTWSYYLSNCSNYRLYFGSASSNQIRTYYRASASTSISFSISGGFTGSSTSYEDAYGSGNYSYLQSSGGLIRVGIKMNGTTGYGSWISLT